MEINKEKTYETSFQIIMNAGDAQNAAMKAISAAAEYDFEKADVLIKEAKECLKRAHNDQTEIMSRETGGADVEVTPILMHAYDHYTMALMAVDMANMSIDLNRRIDELSRAVNP